MRTFVRLCNDTIWKDSPGTLSMSVLFEFFVLSFERVAKIPTHSCTSTVTAAADAEMDDEFEESAALLAVTFPLVSGTKLRSVCMAGTRPQSCVIQRHKEIIIKLRAHI